MEMAAAIGFDPGDFMGIYGPEDGEAMGRDVNGFSADGVIESVLGEINFDLVMLLKIAHWGSRF